MYEHLIKPENYNYYADPRNGVKCKDWPVECREYKRLRRVIRRHPDWNDLSIEEVHEKLKESKRMRGVRFAEASRKTLSEKSAEEKALIDAKKGSYYQNMSDEEKLKHNEVLRQRSLGFWNNMSDEQRKEFGQYRWNLKSDEEKQKIIDQFRNGNDKWRASLTEEDIQKQVKKMNDARIKKLEENEEFRLEQFELLRKHNREYFESMKDSDKIQMLKHNKFNDKFENRFYKSSISKYFHLVQEMHVSIDGADKYWDYGIYSNDTVELIAVIDLDGAFYHADNCDYNGLQCREDRDEKRGCFVPQNIKVYIILEERFNETFAYMENNLLIDFPSYINSMFKDLRSIEFPYPSYSNAELINSFKQLIRLIIKDDSMLSIRNREGDRIINHFHHSIYHAHRKNKPSPYDAWYNDDLLRKCIENRTIYQNHLNPNKILQGFNISKIAPKVSVFSAGRAKLLIYKYLNEFNEIFDPFSGFSGRTLGAISLGKHYIGQDISGIHVDESIKLWNFLKMCKNHFPDIIEPSLECRNVLNSSGEYECLFTCPPYSDKEIWKGEISDTKSCDDWIDICLDRFKCKRYLFVVDNTDKYREYVTDVIVNRSHFGKNNEYVIMIDGED